MHASSHSLDKRGSKGRGKIVSSFGSSAPDLLTLPSLDKAVPDTVEFDHSGSRWARIALLWFAAGELNDADEGHPRVLAATAIKRWMGKQLAGVNHLGQIDITIQSYPDLYGEMVDRDGEEGLRRRKLSRS